MRKIIIIGKGGAGTSAVAKMLYEQGYYFGDNLKGPDERQPHGYYENQDLIDFEVQVLDKRGYDIHQFPLFSGWDLVFTPKEVERGREIINNIDVWKSERTLWTWHIFDGIIEEPTFIVVNRHIYDIGKSLSKRMGYSQGKGELLALNYYALVDKFFEKYKYPRIDIDYEDLPHPQ